MKVESARVVLLHNAWFLPQYPTHMGCRDSCLPSRVIKLAHINGVTLSAGGRKDQRREAENGMSCLSLKSDLGDANSYISRLF